MVGFNVNSSSEQYKFINNTLQQNQESCAQNNSNIQKNTIFIGNNLKLGNNACINCIQVNTDSTCLITSGMDNNVQQYLTTAVQLQNKQAAGWFNNFKKLSVGVNVSNLKQSVTNNISQINQASCVINNTVSQQGTYAYISGSAGNNFRYNTQDSNFTSNCTMNNTMASITQQATKRKLLLSNTRKSIFIAIAAIFAGVIGLVIIGAIILFGTGAIGHVGYNSSGSKTAPVESEEALVESLGIDPGILAESLQGGSSESIPETNSET